jgi:hypothetical protein
MSEIVTEFGGAAPHWLGEYYSGGAYVPGGTTGVDGVISSAGAINMHQFYGATAAINIDWILVGGGGGGASGMYDRIGGGGGGGGGGGVAYGTWTGAASSFFGMATIGAGAAAGVTAGMFGNYVPPGTAGSNTTITGALTATASGGEGGGSANQPSGGSLFGGAGGSPNGSARAGYAASGNSNGIGAGSGGGSVDDSWARSGGNGYRWPFNSVYYGGGGGGGGDNSGTGGLGGGGSSNGSGLVNTGGGGAGGQEGVGGGAGGSGVAIFSYVSPTQLLSGGTVTTTGTGAATRWFHKITSTGYITSLSASTTPFAFAQTISSNTTNYNLQSAAFAAGWNMVAPLIATITINPGVTLYSTSSPTPAFDTGAMPAGSSVNVINNGTIVGASGLGGAGGIGSGNSGAAGGAGGTGLRVTGATSVTNNGIIAGGGGGGGGDGGFSETDFGGNYVSELGGGSGGNGAGINTAGLRGGARGQAGTAGIAGLVSFNWDTQTQWFNGNSTGGAGGAGGAATQGNAYITWVATGTRIGALN